jgi:D-tyrosyl-tRNA(Tyr) deacylase
MEFLEYLEINSRNYYFCLEKKITKMNNNLQYLTDENGNKTAVVVPYREWLALKKERDKLKQLVKFKTNLKSAFVEFENVKNGKEKIITLSDFLDES